MKKEDSSHEKVIYGVIKVSPKGQIIIPADLRNELDIKQGDQLVVTKNKSGDGIEILKMKVLNDMFLSSRSYQSD